VHISDRTNPPQILGNGSGIDMRNAEGSGSVFNGTCFLVS